MVGNIYFNFSIYKHGNKKFFRDHDRSLGLTSLDVKNSNMTTIIKYVEVSATGSYCIDGKKYLRSTYKKGTYAAFNDNSICYLLIPATKEAVDEYITRFGNDERVTYHHLKQMFNAGITFSISYFEAIITKQKKSITKIRANYQDYDSCIKNAIEISYEIIAEGVYKENVNDTIRSRDVVFCDDYDNSWYTLTFSDGSECRMCP